MDLVTSSYKRLIYELYSLVQLFPESCILLSGCLTFTVIISKCRYSHSAIYSAAQNHFALISSIKLIQDIRTTRKEIKSNLWNIWLFIVDRKFHHLATQIFFPSPSIHAWQRIIYTKDFILLPVTSILTCNNFIWIELPIFECHWLNRAFGSCWIWLSII